MVEIAAAEEHNMLEYEFITKEDSARAERQKEVLANWGDDPPKPSDIYRDDLKPGQPPTNALPWSRSFPNIGEESVKPAPSDYDTLVEQKSPLVRGLSEQEFHSKYDYNDELGAWKIKNESDDAPSLGKLQKLLHISKVSTPSEDDEDGQRRRLQDTEEYTGRNISPKDWETLTGKEQLEHLKGRFAEISGGMNRDPSTGDLIDIKTDNEKWKKLNPEVSPDIQNMDLFKVFGISL